MALNYEQFRGLSSDRPWARPRIEWLTAGEQRDERALAYGFSAIAAFVFGGFGYLNGLLSMREFGASVFVAFVAFVASYRHMGATTEAQEK
jgi:hypothetical protein